MRAGQGGSGRVRAPHVRYKQVNTWTLQSPCATYVPSTRCTKHRTSYCAAAALLLSLLALLLSSCCSSAVSGCSSAVGDCSSAVGCCCCSCLSAAAVSSSKCAGTKSGCADNLPRKERVLDKPCSNTSTPGKQQQQQQQQYFTRQSECSTTCNCSEGASKPDQGTWTPVECTQTGLVMLVKPSSCLASPPVKCCSLLAPSAQ